MSGDARSPAPPGRDPSPAAGGPFGARNDDAPASRRTTVLILLLVVALVAFIAVFPPGETTRATATSDTVLAALDGAPAAGTWRVDVLGRVSEVLVADHPIDPGCVVVGWVRRSAEGEPSSRVRGRVLSRARAMQFLFPGSRDLFERNYVRSEGPALDPDAPGLLRIRWTSRHRPDSETSRTLWIDGRGGPVVRLEDRSHHDRVVRSVRRTSLDHDALEIPEGTPGEAPSGVADPSVAEGACSGGTQKRRRSVDLRRIAAETPFPLLAPGRLPRGFELVSSRYGPWMPSRGDGQDPVRIATLIYSDGLATMMVLEAPPADLDRFEAFMRAMRDRPASDASACPTQPESQPATQVGDMVIRRRRDPCRTVLRVDDYDGRGVGVTLVAQNELSDDLYVDVMTGLELVEPAPPNAD